MESSSSANHRSSRLRQEQRLALLEKPGYGWACTTHAVAKPGTAVVDGAAAAGGPSHYLYAMSKLASAVAAPDQPP